VRFRSLGLSVETPSELVVTGNITCFLDEVIQLFVPINERNHCTANVLVDITQEVDVYPAEVGVGAKLSDEHFEFVVVLLSSAGVLHDCFNAREDLSFAVSGLVVFFECFQELFERWEKSDIFIRVNILYQRFSIKEGSSKASLELHRNLGKLHVLFYAEGPGHSLDKRNVSTVEFIKF